MKKTYKIILFMLFLFLFILLTSSKTKWRVCQVCGVQEYETSILGKTYEFLSQREFDEFGTYKKWREKYGREHKPHNWKLIEQKNRDIIKLIDSL